MIFLLVIPFNLLLTATSLSPPAADSAGLVRIKDIARPREVRTNQLVGYGLVVGLDGTGDSPQVTVTAQALRNLVTSLGVTPDPSARMRSRNAAAVIVTAELPAFAQPGDRVDVTVSSLGDARSLQGGMLLQTPLQGADAAVYVVAQGSISVGGFAAGGPGARVAVNHVTVGRVPNGGIVETASPSSLPAGSPLTLSLHRPDFATATEMARAIEAALQDVEAEALDAGAVRIRPLDDSLHGAALMAAVGAVQVAVDVTALIVINERTGTIVVGGPVTIAPVAVAHGDLTVEVSTVPLVSQPPPFATGETVMTPLTSVAVQEKPAVLASLQAATVEDLVKCLNALHATPRDLIAILQAMKTAGALHATLEVM